MQPEIPTNEPRKFSIWRLLKRLVLGIVITVVSLVGLSALLVYIYEDDVKALVIKELNKHLNAEVRIQPENIDLTIIKTFPDCALEFCNFTIMEANTLKEKDTLLHAERLALAFNVKDLFNKNYTIKKIILEKASADMKVDKKGVANYIIWKTDSTAGSDSLNFALEKISLQDIELSYKNSKQKIKLLTHIAELQFKGKFSTSDYQLETDGNAYVEFFQAAKIKYIEDKKVKFDLALDVKSGRYTITHSETSLNSTKLVSNGSFVIHDSLLSLDVNFNGKNLDISSTLSLLPEKYQNQISDYSSEGEFYARGEFHYKNGKPLTVRSEFGIKNASINYKPGNISARKVNLDGSLVIDNVQSNLKLNNITAELNANNFSGNMELAGLSDPYLKLAFTANTKLDELLAFYPVDTVQEASGSLAVSAQIEGLLRDLRSNPSSATVKSEGVAKLSELRVKFKNSEKELNIPHGDLRLEQANLHVQDLKLLKGNSDVTLNGSVIDFLGYVFDNTKPLVVDANVNSEKIEVEDFLFPAGNSSSGSEAGISAKLNLDVKVAVKQLSFGKFTASDIKGGLLVKHQKAAVSDFYMRATDGDIRLNAIADASGANIVVSGDCDLTKLNIQKLFSQLNNFGQTTLEDKHLKGFVTANVDFTTTWDRQLHADPASINATSSILIERGELIGFKPLESLAKYIDVNELKHIKFSTLQSAIEIKNKVITLPKTSIKSNAINLELWGRHNFDNTIEYHIQLLLSELLAKKQRANKELDEELALVENDPENRRSVFIVMTGPIDNPTIKYDRKGAKEKIKEDIRQEKQNLKQILKEEFGLFKKDTVKTKDPEKANQKFNIQFGEEKPKQPAKTLQPKKKEEDEDF